MGSGEIDPCVDFAFKRIFGAEDNNNLLKSLINSVVSDEDNITDVALLNPYNLKSYKEDKETILDIKAKTRSGERFNIEIQVLSEKNYDKRALYYWAKLYTQPMKNRDQFVNLRKTIGIHILDFDLWPDLESYHNVFCIMDKDKKTCRFNDLELHTIELRKFIPKDNEDELSEIVEERVHEPLDKWCTFFARSKLLDKDSLPPQLNNEELRRALEVLEEINMNEEELELYNARRDWIINEQAGRQEALEKGRVEGRVEGRMEEKVEIAKNLLVNGVPIDIICVSTGLSRREVEELAYDMTTD